MAVKFGSILHVNNSGSEATLDANNLRGTTLQIDNFDSASLAKIGTGLASAPGKRRLGTIVSTTGSYAYYIYSQTGSGDVLLGGPEWTTLTNWKQIATLDLISDHITLPINTISSSAQIATEISGAFNGVTSSFLLNTTSTLTGDLTVTGKITAEEFHTEFVTSSVMFASGSSRFGNTSDDIHSFTGSILLSGSSLQFNGLDVLTNSPWNATAISGAFNGITGSFLTSIPVDIISSSAQIASEISGAFQLLANITASGNISASGALMFSSSLNTSTSLKTLMYDTVTGQIYHTGSYATGGGGVSGTTFPFAGQAIITGSLIVSGNSNQDVEIYNDVLPGETDEYGLGSSTKKWNSIFATNTFFGGIHEINLETIGIGQLQTGTVLVSKAGQMVPCDKHADSLVMGVVTSGSDYPIIMGAEPILVDGAVYEGDYIITSNRVGYGKAVPPDQIFKQGLFGKIIAQSLETNYDGGSIKAMIRKM